LDAPHRHVAANAAMIIGGLFVLLTFAYYGLLMLFRSGD
jgi:hypothetical protein